MKAYQVFKVFINKYEEVYEIQATYLDYNKAYEHTKEIAKKEALIHKKEIIENKLENKIYWTMQLWNKETIAELRTIDIIE